MWEKQSISTACHTEEISHWAQRIEKTFSSPWSWWEFCHWLGGDRLTPTLSKGMLWCWAQRGSHPRQTAACCTITGADSVQNLFFAQWLSFWHGFVPLVLFVTASCGDGTKLTENLLTNMKWRSQDPRIARTLNSGRMRGLEINAKGNKDLFPALKYSEQNQMIKLYFIPWKD